MYKKTTSHKQRQQLKSNQARVFFRNKKGNIQGICYIIALLLVHSKHDMTSEEQIKLQMLPSEHINCIQNILP
jgi:hypothetical protein